MEAADWRNELEALQRLLANQQQQIEVLQKQARPKYFAIFCQSSKEIF